jgi:hypothetical protein
MGDVWAFGGRTSLVRGSYRENPIPNVRSVGESPSPTDLGESRVRRARKQRGSELSKLSKNPRLVRVVLILGAIASFAAAAGAGTRWG